MVHVMMYPAGALFDFLFVCCLACLASRTHGTDVFHSHTAADEGARRLSKCTPMNSAACLWCATSHLHPLATRTQCTAPLDLPSPGQTDSASGSTHALQLPAIHTAMAASPPAPATAPPTMGVAWPTPPQAHPHLPATANPPGALLSGLAFPVPVAEAPAPAVMDVPGMCA